MYRKLAGINQLEPGYKKILIKPQFIKGITSVEATFNSVYGEIKSAWTCRDYKITVDVVIPANTTALVYLPEKASPIEVGSGPYHFEYETKTNLERDRFSMDSTLKEILDEPVALQILNQYAPEMMNHPMIEFAYQLSISEILATAPGETETLFKMVIEALNRTEITI
jgi:alpha-L-rhamnosidase